MPGNLHQQNIFWATLVALKTRSLVTHYTHSSWTFTIRSYKSFANIGQVVDGGIALSRALIITLPPRGARWNDREREPEGEICESEREYLRSHAYPLRESLAIIPSTGICRTRIQERYTFEEHWQARFSICCRRRRRELYSYSLCSEAEACTEQKPRREMQNARRFEGWGGGWGGGGGVAPRWEDHVTRRNRVGSACCTRYRIVAARELLYVLTCLTIWRVSVASPIERTCERRLFVPYGSGWRKRNFLEKNANKQYTLYIVKK